MDIEAELEKSKAELVQVAGHTRENDKRLYDNVRAATEAKQHAAEAESEARSREQALGES